MPPPQTLALCEELFHNNTMRARLFGVFRYPHPRLTPGLFAKGSRNTNVTLFYDSSLSVFIAQSVTDWLECG
jgi:hypothetical protein